MEECRKGGYVRQRGKIINCYIEVCFEQKGQPRNTRGSTGYCWKHTLGLEV